MSKRYHWCSAKEPKYTCPNIDAVCGKLQRALEDFQDVVKEILSDLEDVRTENVNLREWGNDVVSDAQSAIDDLESKVSELEAKQ